MTNRLWYRLVWYFITAALIGSVLTGVLVNVSVSQRFAEYVVDNNRTRNQRIAEAIEGTYRATGSWVQTGYTLMHFGMMGSTRVKVVDRGQVVFDSGTPQEQPMGMMHRGMGRGMGRWFPGGWDQTPGEGQTAVLPLNLGERQATVYITSYDRQGIWSPKDLEFRRSLNTGTLIAALLAGVIAVAASLIVTRRITQPVTALTEAVNRIAEGQWQERVDVEGDDEIARLGKSFNQMAFSLEKLVKLRKKLTADVAHELRTPVNNVLNYVEAFEDGVLTPDAENLHKVHAEVKRLATLVEDLGELARSESLSMRLMKTSFDLRELVEEVAESFRPLMSQTKIDLKTTTPAQPLMVYADREALARVIGNILSNAAKYTEPGGRVGLEVADSPGGVEVRILDTGIGIPSEDLPYIFERFFRVDKSRSRATGGSGIGLAVVKELVEAHGGRIEVESEPGKGSTFTVWIPTGVTDGDN